MPIVQIDILKSNFFLKTKLSIEYQIDKKLLSLAQLLMFANKQIKLLFC